MALLLNQRLAWRRAGRSAYDSSRHTHTHNRMELGCLQRIVCRFAPAGRVTATVRLHRRLVTCSGSFGRDAAYRLCLRQCLAIGFIASGSLHHDVDRQAAHIGVARLRSSDESPCV